MALRYPVAAPSPPRRGAYGWFQRHPVLCSSPIQPCRLEAYLEPAHEDITLDIIPSGLHIGVGRYARVDEALGVIGLQFVAHVEKLLAVSRPPQFIDQHIYMRVAVVGNVQGSPCGL